MGLDIYLRQYKNVEDTKRREAEYEERSNEVWKKVYGVAHDDDAGYTALKNRLGESGMDELYKKYKAQCAPIAKELKLDDWGTDEDGKKDIEINSTKYPEHMFKIGYLRSSYNSGGINHKLEDLTGKDLYYIFEPNDEYEFKPDWEKCLERCKLLLAEFKQATGDFPYQVHKIDKSLSGTPVKSIEDVIAKFKKVVKEHDPVDEEWAWFSNAEGHFYLGKEPLKVRGIFVGTERFPGGDYPAAYVVTDAEDNYTWYIQALEITQEMLEWVLKQPKAKREKLMLVWSS